MEICSVMNGDKHSNKKSTNLLKSNSKEELALDALCYPKDIFTNKSISPFQKKKKKERETNQENHENQIGFIPEMQRLLNKKNQ